MSWAGGDDKEIPMLCYEAVPTSQRLACWCTVGAWQVSNQRCTVMFMSPSYVQISAPAHLEPFGENAHPNAGSTNSQRQRLASHTVQRVIHLKHLLLQAAVT